MSWTERKTKDSALSEETQKILLRRIKGKIGDVIGNIFGTRTRVCARHNKNKNEKKEKYYIKKKEKIVLIRNKRVTMNCRG